MATLRAIRPNWRHLYAAASMLALLGLAGGVAARLAGESARTTRIVEQAEQRLQRETRADCHLQRDIAALPADSPDPGKVLLQLAADARLAYLARGCVAVLGPPPPAYR
jgi:hypothetical protein